MQGKALVVDSERLVGSDPDDWPVLASALALRCPIWTEDTDFFGCGVATWTSNRVRVFLRRDVS
jgi:predicted nucleic acid-binding protein